MSVAAATCAVALATIAPAAAQTGGELEVIGVYDGGGSDVSAVVQVPGTMAGPQSQPRFDVRDGTARVLPSESRPLLDGDDPVRLLVMPGSSTAPVGLAEVRGGAADLVLSLGPDVKTLVVDPQAPSSPAATADVAAAVSAIARVQPGGAGSTAAVSASAGELGQPVDGPRVLVAYAPQADDDPLPAEDLTRTLQASRTLLYVVAPTADAGYWAAVVRGSGGAVLAAPAESGADLAEVLRRQFLVDVDAGASEPSALQVRARSGQATAAATVVLDRGTVSAEGAAATVGGLLLGLAVVGGGVVLFRSRRARGRRSPTSVRSHAADQRLPAGRPMSHVRPRRFPRMRSGAAGTTEAGAPAARHVRPRNDAEVSAAAVLPQNHRANDAPENDSLRFLADSGGRTSVPAVLAAAPPAPVAAGRAALLQHTGGSAEPERPAVHAVVLRCQELVEDLDRCTAATDAGDMAALPRCLLLLADRWPGSGVSPARTAAGLSDRLAALERDVSRGAVDVGHARGVMTDTVDSLDRYWWDRMLMPPGCAATVRRCSRQVAAAARRGDLQPARKLAAELRHYWLRLESVADADTGSASAFAAASGRLKDLPRMVFLVDELFQARSLHASRETVGLRTALVSQGPGRR